MLNHTYALCIDQNAARFFTQLQRSTSCYCWSRRKQHIFQSRRPVRPDNAFHNWWENSFKWPKIPDWHFMPILMNIQGHPVAQRLWSRHIHKILTNKLKLKPTTHEQCLYIGTFFNKKSFLTHQVDNFAILALSTQIAKALFEELDQYLIEMLKIQNIILYFNGVNLVQTRTCIIVNCCVYIDWVLERHGWQNLSPNTNKGAILMTTQQNTGTWKSYRQKKTWEIFFCTGKVLEN